MLTFLVVLVSLAVTAWPLVALYGWMQRRWPMRRGGAWRAALRMAPFAIVFFLAEPVVLGILVLLGLRVGLH